jgi:predicted amidohydrolase
LKARAIENQAYVIGVNRIGKDPYYTYTGQSGIADPHGVELASAGDREACIRARVDLDNLRKYRDGLPFLNDMRGARKPGPEMQGEVLI